MDNSQLPIHDERKFTTGFVAGHAYLISEAPTLGRGWFGRAVDGSVAFRVLCPLTKTTTTYRFVRERATELGKRHEYRGSDGSTAHVYDR